MAPAEELASAIPHKTGFMFEIVGAVLRINAAKHQFFFTIHLGPFGIRTFGRVVLAEAGEVFRNVAPQRARIEHPAPKLCVQNAMQRWIELADLLVKRAAKKTGL